MRKYLAITTSNFSGLIAIVGLSISLVTFFVSHVSAQMRDDEPTSPERTNYDKSSDLPDGLAYISTVRFLLAVNETDPISAVQLVQDGMMGLSKTEAQVVLHMIESSHESYVQDYDNLTRKLLCPSDRPRAAGNDIYPIFQALGDSDLELGTKHLTALLGQMSEDHAVRFSAWMTTQKNYITYSKINYKQEYERYRAIPDEVQYAICNRLEN